MAKVYDVNRVATYGGATAMFYIKQTLKNAGWVVSASSDGITHFSASDGITTDNSGSGGMNNNRAWFWIVDPANRRGFTAIRNSGSIEADDYNKYWGIIWSEMAFSISATGSVTASITFAPEGKPSQLHGSGTIPVPAGGPLFPVSESFRTHVVAYNTPHNGVYGFYSFCSALGTSTGKTSTIFACDPILSGSISTLDQAPYVIKTIHSVTDANWLNSRALGYYNKTINCPYGNAPAQPYWGNTLSYYRFGMNSGSSTGATYTTCYPNFNGFDINGTKLDSASSYNMNSEMFRMGNDLFEGVEKDILLPWMWVGGQLLQPLYANKYRGYAARFRIHSNSSYDGVGRKYPDTINLSTDAYICVGSGMVMPWPENVPGIA